ncbi:phenoloxidase-activating factor 2-like [Episyrphus balteatus]|uniref:phenoloxidase-activating factor 2-like n=1 Tax=Episyrphus balteatus TaxID=286459 RepID=UPI002485F115|nr:phenoloxidase-activating factor 2-like [Episyrphus balteatus]XP_055836760.1 phenoloxidase-activating factor 2-like [Episyrphus balteatus]
MNAKIILIPIFLIGSCVAQVDEALIRDIFDMNEYETVTGSSFATLENPAQITEDPIKYDFDTHETETVTESNFTTTMNPDQIVEDVIRDVFGIDETETVTKTIFTTTENPATTVVPQKSVTVEQTESSYQPCGTHPGMACVRQDLCNNGYIGFNLRFNFPKRDSIHSCNNPLETCCDNNDMSDLLKLKNGCGYRNQNGVELQNKELADNEAKFGEFPWMVAILNKIILSGKVLSLYNCGGTLIALNVVLTAAHCVNVKQTKNYSVRAGEWEPNSDSEPYSHQERQVAGIIVHEKYNNRSLQNDIALLFLETSFDKAPHINTICLPPASAYTNIGMSRCIASGWGKTNFGTGKYPNILKKIDLPVVPNAKCEKDLRKTPLGRSFKLHYSFMCAGGETGKDTCQGDGGSPLVCPMANNPDRYYQAGIVSWGIECGNENVPGVYASILKLRSWIDTQLGYKNLSLQII